MSDVIYSVRWRLVYLDHRFLDEKMAGSTIMDSRPNPVELHLIDISGQPLIKVDIPPGFKPIFYRQRSADVSPGGGMGEIRLDATIFGYGRESGINGAAKLWMWKKGEAVSCPPEHVAAKAIELQLQN